MGIHLYNKTQPWHLLRWSRTKRTTKEFRSSQREEDKERLITLLEEDLFAKKRISMTPRSIDSLLEEPAPSSSAKLSSPP